MSAEGATAARRFWASPETCGAEPLVPRLFVHRHREELQPVVGQLEAAFDSNPSSTRSAFAHRRL
jgi:hypothetical protein